MECEYFVQLFLENDESMQLPSVEDLLNRMFSEQSISFTEVSTSIVLLANLNSMACVLDSIQAADHSATLWKTVQSLQEDHS